MKSCLVPLAIAWLAISWTGQGAQQVSLTQLKDRIRVEVDGRLFTEWRHQEWVAPYLYPVVGPNGGNITRNYPMKAGVPGESQDHAWHRSLRFAHSDVNGFNFWWAPGKERAGHTAEVKLERIERMTSGRTGELILWNRWLGDGALVLRERVRLAFIPLDQRQMLMDYDVEFHAGDKPVLFGDMKDGGLLVRVAGTMKVEEHRTGRKFGGTILNSRGDRNVDAWGKRAEWVDYFGPDASGQTVGIAMFDHPDNLRFPTYWHARTYGLLTANRFGTDHFAMPEASHLGVVCRPNGDKCPACKSRGGDYTIPKDGVLKLRHRLFFHHGDATLANVTARFAEYADDKSHVLREMRELDRLRQRKELVEQFGEMDFTAWPVSQIELAAEAFHIRGRNYWVLKQGRKGDLDLQAAVQLMPRNGGYWLTLASNTFNNLNNSKAALAAYQKAYEISGGGNGWLPLSASLGAADVLVSDLRTKEALAVLQRHGKLDAIVKVWRIRMLRAFGKALAAEGKDAEALAKFREANELESVGK